MAGRRIEPFKASSLARELLFSLAEHAHDIGDVRTAGLEDVGGHLQFDRITRRVALQRGDYGSE